MPDERRMWRDIVKTVGLGRICQAARHAGEQLGRNSSFIQRAVRLISEVQPHGGLIAPTSLPAGIKPSSTIQLCLRPQVVYAFPSKVQPRSRACLPFVSLLRFTDVLMRVLAISGSLRTASINSAVLRTAARLAPPDVEVVFCTFIGDLPLFNPDLELNVPPSVARLRAEITRADALLIASPEYAHGVTGTIKNMLDWLVSFEQFVDKPVGVLNTAPRAHHADSALRETLKTMSAFIVEPASTSISLLGANIAEEDMAELPTVAHAIRESLAALCSVVTLKQSAGHGRNFP
jgi:chromate reductase, NAD(P)H dehydrogenase (quinone)